MMDKLNEYLLKDRVAYFSMEIALRSEIPTYSGGLGILAGDTLRSAADLNLPMIAVTLVSQNGYFSQQLDEQGHQSERPEPWQPDHYATQLHAKVALHLENRPVWVGAWFYELASPSGSIPIILLDTDLPENDESARNITRQLYGGDNKMRLLQEAVLGIGGVRLLSALGCKPRKFHMNEGHSALLAFELLSRKKHAKKILRGGESAYDPAAIRRLCCFTTHTPVEAGHDKFDYKLVLELLSQELDISALKQVAGDKELNMTRLALNLSGYINGVARKHAEVSRNMFPGYEVHAITNGVHAATWMNSGLQELLDARLPTWRYEPEFLVGIDQIISNREVQETHSAAKQKLFDWIEEKTLKKLKPDIFTIGFARRMTAYKRPNLLFSDIERLNAIAEIFPLQIVFSGKAHEKDLEGKQLIESIYQSFGQLSKNIQAVFLPDYNMANAGRLIAGVDLWLNTPQAPMEASGTSGMKAALNGVPNFSVLDGWWVEGCLEGVTGWSIDASESSYTTETDCLYKKLETTILPLYYQDKAAWAQIMKSAISKNGALFNTHRMMRRYASEAYL